MKASKKDLQIELERTRKQQDILHICLVELARNPDGIKWLCRGEDASKIQWGIVRPTNPSGGYVIVREGAQGEHVFAAYVDDISSAMQGNACFASTCSDSELRQIYENRALVAQDALAYRAKRLEEIKP